MLPKLVPFSDPIFAVFFHIFWNPFSLLFLYFFALGGDLGEAAFLKELPSEIRVLVRPSMHETLRRGVPRRVKKLAPKKARQKTTFGNSVLAPLGTSWAALCALFNNFLAVLPPLGSRGPEREVQKAPKRGQDTLKRPPRAA